jgi:hypothetical protein
MWQSNVTPRRCSLTLAGIVLLVLALGAGCGGTERGGAARLAISGAALSAGLTKMVVTISRGSGPDFAPLVETLSTAGTNGSAFISGIQAGTGRQFDVVGYDSSGQPLCSGSAQSDIVPGAMATVFLVLEPAPGPVIQQYAAPVIDFLSASQTLVARGGTATLGASAHDPDAADTVSYQWAATCGTFDDARKPAVAWTAPNAAGSCQVSLTAADGRGASVQASLPIEVF